MHTNEMLMVFDDFHSFTYKHKKMTKKKKQTGKSATGFPLGTKEPACPRRTEGRESKYKSQTKLQIGYKKTNLYDTHWY